MAQQKLYTEEQVRKAIAIGYDWCHLKHIPSDDMVDSFIESLNPIKLPSDEEIKKEAKDNCEYNQDSLRQFDSKFIDTFIDGAKWMRDQILNK